MAGLRCECAPLPNIGAAWEEAANNYGIEGEGHPWTCNLIAETSVVRDCGRIFVSQDGLESQQHVPGEVDLCRTAGAAAELALKETYVQRGDEGDHKWRAFFAPLLEQEKIVGGNDNDPEPLSPESIKLACGGALWPALGFSASSVSDEIGRLEGRDDDEGSNDGQVFAWKNAVTALSDLGVSRITYFRPLEGHETCGCVFPHFIVGVTPQGSLTGVVGLTVWT